MDGQRGTQLICCPFTSLFIDDTLQVLVRSDRVNVDPLLVIMAKEVVKALLCCCVLTAGNLLWACLWSCCCGHWTVVQVLD